MRCPRCATELEVSFCTGGRMLRCPTCAGTAVTVEMLRRFAPKSRIDDLWQQALTTHGALDVHCAGCEGPLRRVEVGLNGATVALDVCTHCHLVWFDADELHAFSPRRAEPPKDAAGRAADAERIGLHEGDVASRDELWRVVTNLEALFA